MGEASRQRPAFAVHPFLVAVFPILYHYSRFVGSGWERAARELILPLLAMVALTAVVWLVLALVLEARTRAAAACSLILLYLWTFEFANSLSRQLPLPGPGLISRALVMALWLVPGLVAARALARGGNRLRRMTWILNVAALALIAMPLLPTALFYLELAVRDRPAIGSFGEPPRGTAESGHRPDIFYIICDSYAGEEVLNTYFGFENSQFLGELEARGFVIARRSTSNYHNSLLSLASSLNCDYLQALGAPVGPRPGLLRPRRLLDESRVFKFLKQRGYTIVNLVSAMPDVEVRGAPVTVPARRPVLNDFSAQLVEQTPAGMATRLLTGQPVRFLVHRHNLTLSLDHLPDTLDSTGPRLVFAHVACPHDPFVFDEDGRMPSFYPEHLKRDWYDEALGEASARYVAQLRYLNGRILTAVDDLLSRSPRPPVIILQADHGTRFRYRGDGPAREDLVETFSILNAYHLPEGGERVVHDTMTPVNSFRVVLSRYFGLDLELLPDRNYLLDPESELSVYRFVDVTDGVQGSHPAIEFLAGDEMVP